MLNEQDNINPLYQQLTAALSGIREYELIFVDDGSKDGSFDTLSAVHKADGRVKAMPGAVELLRRLKQEGRKTAIGTTSTLQIRYRVMKR